MRNVFFSDETISEDDLFFMCSMIERTARYIKQPNAYVVNKMGNKNLAEKISLAGVLHSEPPQSVVDDWIDEFQLQTGSHDVTNVNPKWCTCIPTPLDMGKVYERLIIDTMTDEEDYVQAIIRVYNNPICEIIDDYNCSAYYEPSPYIARSYYAGGF